MLEPKNIRLDSLLSQVLVPAEIRDMPLVEKCDDAVVSKTWIKCDGISCGDKYYVKYQSGADQAGITQSATNYLHETLSSYKLRIEFRDNAKNQCQYVKLFYSRMFK